VLCDAWAILVLRDIMFGNRRHFRELVAGSEEGIATNILASRLKQLVAAGLLSREATRRGQRAAYSLTEAGIQVLPVMVALGNWGLAHRDGVSPPYAPPCGRCCSRIVSISSLIRAMSWCGSRATTSPRCQYPVCSARHHETACAAMSSRRRWTKVR
jgi:DNA-binding HxlR family transcriptional regulator